VANLRFVVALTTHDNDYQIEQAAAAELAAKRLGAKVEILYANNDAVEQSQQILKVIQASYSADSRPDGIVVEPVGTPLPSAARAAAAAGIGWVILNRDADYITELRQSFKSPVFTISSDHEEIGRIQGQQFAALLPLGGTVLYIQGPAGDAAAGRTRGMLETKPANIQARLLRGNWTEASAEKAVTSWLRLSTSRNEHIDVVGAQDDSMAAGARKAFEEQPAGPEREKWRNLLYTGCDGLPKTGQTWVRQGILKATVVVPANTGMALEMLAKAIRGGVNPLEKAFTAATSYPSIEALAGKKK
jgi:ribose transport system substrate-binding protein